MSLSILPIELLLLITTHLPQGSINNLTQTNRHLYQSLNYHLYQHNIRHHGGIALTFAALYGLEGTTQKLLDAGILENGMSRYNSDLRTYLDSIKEPDFRQGIPAPEVEGESFLKTPLHLATSHGHAHIVKLLLETGRVDPNCIDENPAVLPMEVLRWNDAIVRRFIPQTYLRAMRYPETALMIAAILARANLVKILLDYGAGLDEFGRPDSRVLYSAVEIAYPAERSGWESGRLEVVKWLLSGLGVGVDISDGRYHESLIHVVKNGHAGIVRELLAHGVDANAMRGQSQIPTLWYAVLIRNATVLQVLLEYGANPDYGSLSPLMQAAKDGDETILKLLLNNGADVNRDHSGHAGDFPLLAAIRGGHLTAMKLLLEFGADPNQSLGWGRYSALDLARRMKKVDMVQQLLIYEADQALR